MNSFYQSVLFEPLKRSVAKISNFLPDLLTFSFIFLLGIFAAILARYVSKLIFRFIRFDNISYRIGLTTFLSKGNIKRSPSDLFSYLFAWAVLLISLIVDLSMLEMITFENIISKSIGYLISFLAAIIIFIAGYALALFAGRAVLIAAVNAQIAGAKWISGAIQLFIIIFSFELGIEQLGIARGIVVATFSIVFGGIILALALAFGIGGKDIAKSFLEKQIKKESEKNNLPDEFSHL